MENITAVVPWEILEWQPAAEWHKRPEPTKVPSEGFVHSIMTYSKYGETFMILELAFCPNKITSAISHTHTRARTYIYIYIYRTYMIYM